MDLEKGVQYFFGLTLITFGLNGFLQFMPAPQMGAAGTQFMQALIATGYMMPIVALIQLVVGGMLLANKYIPLALVLLAPFTVNIVLFHVFLDLASGLFAGIIAALHLYLVYANWDSYDELLEA